MNCRRVQLARSNICDIIMPPLMVYKAQARCEIYANFLPSMDDTPRNALGPQAFGQLSATCLAYGGLLFMFLPLLLHICSYLPRISALHNSILPLGPGSSHHIEGYPSSHAPSSDSRPFVCFDNISQYFTPLSEPSTDDSFCLSSSNFFSPSP